MENVIEIKSFNFAFSTFHLIIRGRGGMADTLVLGANVFDVWVQVPPPAPTKKSPLSTKTKVTFLNDVCLTANDVGVANDDGFA